MSETPVFKSESDVWTGPYRSPANTAADVAGSIHDDATATKLGFRGGTVAGSIHMDQFPPLLIHAFGPRFFETGGLSCYFLNATTHGEPVRTLGQVVEPDSDDAQIEVWMERDDGLRILEGTAAIGSPADPSALRRRLAHLREPGELRMLSNLEVGTFTKKVDARLVRDEQMRKHDAVRTEALDWYLGGSPWGGPIASPAMAVRLLRNGEQGIDFRRARAVGLFGAIEIRHIAGPVMLDRDYLCSAEILAIGSTPKTEYVWYESTLEEKTGQPVAAMIMMLRLMKASSELWTAETS